MTSGYLIGNDAQCVLNGPLRGCGADFGSSETLITAPLASLAKVSSGKPRLPPATPTCRSAPHDDPERYAFQAGHAGSIPVTRSNPTESLTCVIDYFKSPRVAILA